MSCPFCASDAGRALRDALADAPIALSLFATLLPFLILALGVVWIQSIISATAQARRVGPLGRQGDGDA